jgi:hypothetical protein
LLYNSSNLSLCSSLILYNVKQKFLLFILDIIKSMIV